ncbi:DUF4394 domain-containing protein [Streptomyces sp. CAU 1734]|uniref:DUF4394 domain-containing protein n=1 Tax=Streptomyces sp. CAU 1734 TaxID=3140360 RepID=UPI0032609395
MRISAVAVSVCLAAALAAPAFADSRTAPAGKARSGAAGALTAVGLTTDQRLVEFAVDKPSKAVPRGAVNGLSGDTALIGIDYRVQNLKLYGVGDRGGVYTLDPANARAVKVSQLTVGLTGTRFGVDFNPAANRLRVVSDTGQNLRHNIDDTTGPLGTIADGTLTNPTTPPSAAQGVTAAAYTNNDLAAATATTLFDLDTLTDRVVLQSPANTGTLAPTGGLGTDAGPDAGFDIHYSAAKGVNHGFATLRTGTVYRLYAINLLTGTARDLGVFPAARQVADIALPIGQS